MAVRPGEVDVHGDARLLARLVASLDGIVWQADADTLRLTFVSDQAERLLGYPHEAWLEPGFWHERVHPEDRERIREGWARTLESGETFDQVHRVVRADGEVRFLHSIGHTLRDANDRPLCMLGIAQDITELRRTERERRTSEARLRVVMDHATDAFFVHDATRHVLDVNEQACTSLGYSREELIGSPPGTFDAGPGLEHLEEIDRLLDAGGVASFDTSHRRKDGTTFPVEVRVRRFWDDGQRHAVSIARDITERKRAEEVLAAREAELRVLAEMSPGVMGTFHMRADGTVAMPYCSPRLWELFGLRPEEVVDDATPVLDRTHPDDRAGMLASMQESARTLTPWRHEYRIVHPTRGVRWLEGSTRPKPQPDGGILWYGFVHDITERKRAEETLRVSEARFRVLVDHASDAFFLQGQDGEVLDVNQRACDSLGYTREELIGSTPLLFDADVTPEGLEQLGLRLQRGEVMAFESRHRRKDGSVFPVEIRIGTFRDGNKGYAVSLAHDITERTRLEEQLRQSQKMEAVGRLAGGVAHDFNNLLTAINGFAEMVVERLEPGDPSRDLMAEIRKAGERAAGLTRQLLAFSRKQVLQPQVVRVNRLLEDLLKLLRPLLGEDIDLLLLQEPGLDLARVDPGQFEQAILNLAVNARDAMPGGGRLTIETRNAFLGPEVVQHSPDVRPGEYVQVTVTDNGQGMDEETRTRAFEPFYTTKGPGKGTGLGLAMVYGFVKQSGGHVEVESEPGHGTTVRVFLPSAVDASASEAPAPDESKSARGTETVLLVEDEDSVRALSRMVLHANGYQVLEARNGQEALWVAEQHDGPIHVLVTDLVMPRLGGRPLAEALSRSRPALRVLFVSGYAAEVEPEGAASRPGTAFLQKPFSAVVLPRKVRELLDTREG